MNTGNKTPGIVAIVFGAISICTFYIPFFSIVTLILSVVGLVLAIKSKQSFEGAPAPSKVPVIGLVLCIIGLVLSVVGLGCSICSTCMINEAAKDPNFVSEISKAVESAAASAAQ